MLKSFRILRNTDSFVVKVDHPIYTRSTPGPKEILRYTVYPSEYRYRRSTVLDLTNVILPIKFYYSNNLKACIAEMARNIDLEINR